MSDQKENNPVEQPDTDRSEKPATAPKKKAGGEKKDLSKKGTSVPRQPMPEQVAADRVQNFDEVPFGYTEETAMIEAARCLACKKPKCRDGCPVEIDILSLIHI